MAAYRHQATWRSILFNEGLEDLGTDPEDPTNIVEAKLNDQFTLDALDVQRASSQDYRELRQYLEGAEPNEAFEGVRAINGTGLISGPTRGSLEDKAWLLNEQFSIAACRQAADTLTPKGVLPFDFKRDTVGGTKALRFYARPGPARPIWIGRRREGLTRPYSFQLIAFDPFAYDQTETQTTLGNLSGGANTVTNPGNLYTKPRIRITFSGVGSANVTLANTTTSQSFFMQLHAAAPDPPAGGEVWILDVDRGTMYRQSDGAGRYGSRLGGFLTQMFLVPGANTITWSVATGITSVRFDFRGAYA